MRKKITTYSSFFSLFIPTKTISSHRFSLTSIFFIFPNRDLSGVNIFVPTTQDIIDWGGNYGPLTIEMDGGACCLLALFISIFHLLMNCYALAMLVYY
jgi:rhomboid protease GluP